MKGSVLEKIFMVWLNLESRIGGTTPSLMGDKMFLFISFALGVEKQSVTTRAMLLTTSLPKSRWEEAVSTAYYLQNCTPHACNPKATPYFHWFGKVP